MKIISNSVRGVKNCYARMVYTREVFNRIPRIKKESSEYEGT